MVRRSRVQAGLSQEGLAAVAGLDRTYVSSLERGRRNPTLATQRRIADALGIRLSSLVRDAEEL
ncbi:helix-turn-helix domain-containing protein [Tsukamurella ocularis]|uniref:helix-turn-helix domain-containing protein n=1 Tax=Tsukamurella ocularis TaxID=1970234 RepID=UPI0039EFDECC